MIYGGLLYTLAQISQEHELRVVEHKRELKRKIKN